MTLNLMINHHFHFEHICHVLYKILCLPVARKNLNSLSGSLGIGQRNFKVKLG